MEANGIVVEEVAGGFETFLIGSAGDFGDDTQAGGRLGAADEVAGHLDRLEHDGLQARETWQNRRCSIGLYFEQPGG